MKNYLYIFIVLIGLLQIIGYVTSVKAIRNLGIATASSPLPIVFTEVKGVETFASDFFLRYTTQLRTTEELQITPTIYSKLKGAYNRRNVYGAAISYGPVMPEDLRNAVLEYGLCSNRLNKEFGLPDNLLDVSVFIKTKTAGRTDSWTLTPDCSQ